MAEFNLPGSSFAEVRKIIMAYAHAKPDATLDDIANLSGIHKTIVSRNNKFLSEIALIQGGHKKSITDVGRKLSRAIEHTQGADEKIAWQEAVQSNEPLSSVLTTVRIKSGMSDDDLTKHILYVSGQSNTKGNQTGARTVQDVLLASSMLVEDNGMFSVSSPKVVAEQSQPLDTSEFSHLPTDVSSVSDASSVEGQAAIGGGKLDPSNGPTISINIQLQLPETKDAKVYDSLFSSLKEHLFPDR